MVVGVVVVRAMTEASASSSSSPSPSIPVEEASQGNGGNCCRNDSVISSRISNVKVVFRVDRDAFSVSWHASVVTLVGAGDGHPTGAVHN